MIDIKAFNDFVDLLRRNFELGERLLTEMSALSEKELFESILSAEQACKYLKISKSTLIEEENSGRLTPSRLGKKKLKRYFVSELNNYLYKHKRR